jgi:hypothetical protein
MEARGELFGALRDRLYANVEDHPPGQAAVPEADALGWVRSIAARGDADAEHLLGRCYELGVGVAKDPMERVKWYRKAAEQGDADSQLSLAYCYTKGTGVYEDPVEAAKWYRRAAEQGDEMAQYELGLSYANGEGLPQNSIEAYKWLILAAAGDRALHRLAGDARDSVAQVMARAEIIEGQRLAAAFVPKKEGAPAPGVDNWARPRASGAFVGTGFFVTDDGYLVTCEHVVHGATHLQIKSAGASIRAKLVTLNETLDIAVLKVEGAFRPLPVARQANVKLGEAVFTIGFPNPDVQGLEPKLTRGEISGMAGAQDNPRYFQISVPVQPGNSGGALVDERGNAVGVVSARLDDVATYELSGAFPQNVNYAVKGSLLYTFLSKVPDLASKLKAPGTSKDRETASAAAEGAAVLVVAE